MVRPTALLRNAAKGVKPPKSADHNLYHFEPQGFWKKFRDVVVVNPEISSGLPLPALNRNPPPASRTERYATPSSSASDPAFNPYWKRDSRRAYPQTSYITQTQLSTLLLSSPALASLPTPSVAATPVPNNNSAIAPSSEQPNTGIATSEVPALSDVLEKLPQGSGFLGAGIETGTGAGGGKLPPLPPSLGKWKPKAGDEIPHGEHVYFPMIGYN